MGINRTSGKSNSSEGWSYLDPGDLLSNRAEQGSGCLNDSIQVITANVYLHGSAATQPCLKYPGLGADTEHAGDGMNRLSEKR